MSSLIQPMLAKPYKDQSPVNYLMSEKLDGVRVIWDRTRLLSRNGKAFHAPDWFIAGLPNDVILDGELWEDRGQFQKTVGKIRAHSGDWSSIKFMVFDLISVNNRCLKNKPFSFRYDGLLALDLPPQCEVVKQTVCRSKADLNAFEANIISLGGEGVMLRDSQSKYIEKRSSALLKVKQFKTDEAVITGYKSGKGRLINKVGALICRYKGKVFQVGSGLNDYLRTSPPPIGSLLTFSFFELTDAGIPRHPSFVAVRDYE